MRNRYLDLLRALAVIRVVVYHVTGLATLTLVFPAMSVMFALAGSLMAASLDRSGVPAVPRRLRRLLPSLWVVAAIFVPAMLLTGLVLTPRVLLWLFPVADPPANYWGALALSPIWYLRDYLWFVLASPVALWLFRRAPLPTLLAPYALLVAVESGVLATASPVAHHFGLYFGAWLLGFAHHDGMLRRLANRVLVPAALALGAAGGAWILTHPGPRGYDLNDIPLGNALWSAAFILLMIGRAPDAAAWVDRSRLVSRLVTLVNRRALTIYLWHMPFVVLLTPMVGLVGWTDRDPVGLAVRVALVFALVGVVALLVGWVEDIAARRRPELLPGGRPRTVTAPSAATGQTGVAGPPEMPTSPPPAGARLGPLVPVGTVGRAVAPSPRRAAADSPTVDLNAGRG
ncbi:acyltransferase [Micromonospora sp. KC723]|uniref:acyltransferase family protein n=1 Tax=Micromonospora sp. KC723 TaxID=2530381 RepID=UPI00104C390F|nr:acyltransferase [Micromonospora sp. KC723]TDB71711.1 acyltransferase [Micromonospora sp. KC723]